MLARARGIPMIVQLGSVPPSANPSASPKADPSTKPDAKPSAKPSAKTALLDGEGATLELDPTVEQVGLFERRRELHQKNRASARAILRRPPASWGGEKIRLLINIQRVEDLEHADAQYADGIGLMRTEFLLGGEAGLLDEETQYQAYDAVLRWAGTRPVTIRTFDAGGDKPMPGFTVDGEANPFLGVRGLRLCLARPEIFTVQLRALARAAVRGNLKVMFPMVTTPEELEAGRRLFVDAVERLQAQGIRGRVSGSRNHGRGAGRRPDHRAVQRGILFDRLQRSRAICDGLRSHQWRAGEADRSSASGGARSHQTHCRARQARRPERQPVRRHGRRSALCPRLARLAACASSRSILRRWRWSSKRSMD